MRKIICPININTKAKVKKYFRGINFTLISVPTVSALHQKSLPCGRSQENSFLAGHFSLRRPDSQSKVPQRIVAESAFEMAHWTPISSSIGIGIPFATSHHRTAGPLASLHLYVLAVLGLFQVPTLVL